MIGKIFYSELLRKEIYVKSDIPTKSRRLEYNYQFQVYIISSSDGYDGTPVSFWVLQIA